jgi:alpha-galactosidase
MWVKAILLSSLAASATAYNNGMGRKPPMGWQTWCSVGPCGTDHCFDGQIREMADTLVNSGMKDLGYNWVILDDCWHPSRNKNGTLVPFPRFFPNGMKPVIDYVHSKGLQFGLYTSVGDKTCHGGWSPGSYGHYEEDANTFAAWGVDYVKIDYCGGNDSVDGHKEMSRALNKTGRHISYMLCRGPYQKEDKWGYAPDIAQGWRATGDHHDSFDSTLDQVNAVRNKSTWSKPYGWAYLDMMMTGGQGCKDQGTGGGGESGHWNWTVPKHCPGHTDDEYRSEASFYVVVSSPMMVGTDIRLMTPIMKELLLNDEAIAINQDYLATPGDAVPACGTTGEVWLRKLSDGDFAIAMPNLGKEEAELSFCLDTLGWPHGDTAHVRNVWAKKDLGTISKKFTAKIRSHDSLLLRLSAKASPVVV